MVCPIRIPSVSPLLSASAQYQSRALILFIHGPNEIFHLCHISAVWNWKRRGRYAVSNCDLLNEGKALTLRSSVARFAAISAHELWRNKHSIWKVMIIRQENVCSQIISNGNTNHWLGEIETCRNLLEGCGLHCRGHCVLRGFYKKLWGCERENVIVSLFYGEVHGALQETFYQGTFIRV